MNIKLIVNDNVLDLGAALRGRKAAAAACLLSLFAVGSVFAAAPSVVPHTFQSGDVVSASKINENFQTLLEAVQEADQLALDAQLTADDIGVTVSGLGGGYRDISDRVYAVELEVNTKASTASLNDVGGRVSALEGKTFLSLYVVGGNNGGVSCSAWCTASGHSGCVKAVAQNYRSSGRSDGTVGCGTIVKDLNGGTADSLTCTCIGA